MENKWALRDIKEPDNLFKLSKALNINHNLTKLLMQRNIATFEEAKKFFRPSLECLHDPFLMKGMDMAVNRLCEAVCSSEKILIYGDYDVDGTTSVSLMYSFLKKYSGNNIEYYIPDRYTEGYGISTKGVNHAKENGFSLIISLDCGIRAVDKARRVNDYGIDLIICDHHLPGSALPAAFSILDPKQPDCPYPFKELSGCGVGFKLLQGFCIQNSIPLKELFQFLDLVAVSIASDIVPIVGENRILAYYGLKKINQDPRPGLKALIEISGLKNKVDISRIVFYVGPRINATGRLTHAHESVKLLVAEKEKEALETVKILDAQNNDRRNLDKSITREALDMIAQDPGLALMKSTVLYNPDWHKGVVGIVASRCVEAYYRPTIILAGSGDMATGSARSVEGYDIHEGIAQCSELLDKFGGHAHAAGLSLPIENVPAFRQKFEEVVAGTIDPELLRPKMEIDLEVDLSFVNHKNYAVINQMTPFGPHNTNPVFSTRKVRLKYYPKIIKENHLKLTLHQPGDPGVYEAIGFGLAKKADLDLLIKAKHFHIAYQIEENSYKGNKSLQLILKDIKID